MTRRVLVTALGTFTATAEGGSLLALRRGAAQTRLPEVPEDKAVLDRLEVQLDEYAHGRRREFDLPMRLVGTSFQTAVWKALRTIPYGEKRTYGEIAAQIGHPKASRAVGAACGKNPILLLVPCHRVVGKDSSLTGFAAGLDLKQMLLNLEHQSALKE